MFIIVAKIKEYAINFGFSLAEKSMLNKLVNVSEIIINERK